MLRSDAWIVGDDEVALDSRVALAMAGLPVRREGGVPLIGLADSSSDLNPCNLPLALLIAPLAEGIRAAGGIPVRFPVLSLGEDLMKPSAMLYRNLLAMELEETVRANPLDGLVLLANCDKSVPGALMGACSTGLPTLVVTCGARPPASFRGRRVGTGTDLWRLWDERRAGRLDDEAWAEVEACLTCGLGSCNTMGTAATMAVLAEVLGFALPGSGTVPVGDPRAPGFARAAGERIVAMVRDGLGPEEVCSDASFANALKVLNAIGGSTNAVIHLAAIAGRLGRRCDLDDVDVLGREIPLLVDVEPSGSGLVQDFDAAGGVPALIGVLGGLLDRQARSADGRTIGECATEPVPGGAIRRLDDPLATGGAFRVVRGSLAPDGAVVKRSAATPGLLRHTGPAVVFHGYGDMVARVDDPSLEVDADSVLVLAGGGPVGAPGMPEWGMIPIPAKLLVSGVRDMVRISDARMSGTSFGTVFLHVAPEAAVGGPLGLVEDGDLIDVDAEAGRIELLVDADELAARARHRAPAPPPDLRGWPALYRRHVTQAPRGCDLDFLEAPTREARVFVEPVIGRS